MFYLAKFQITMRLKGKVGQCMLTLFGEEEGLGPVIAAAVRGGTGTT